jgi:hypothetical protein
MRDQTRTEVVWDERQRQGHSWRKRMRAETADRGQGRGWTINNQGGGTDRSKRKGAGKGREMKDVEFVC